MGVTITKRTLILAATIIAAVLTACTIAIIVALSINTKATGEQNFQQCIAEAGGYESQSTDEKIAIRDMCDGYLR